MSKDEVVGLAAEVALGAVGLLEQVHPRPQLGRDAVADDLEVHPRLVLVVDRVDAAVVGELAGFGRDDAGRLQVGGVVHRPHGDAGAVHVVEASALVALVDGFGPFRAGLRGAAGEGGVEHGSLLVRRSSWL
jgi:hypothetical protein